MRGCWKKFSARTTAVIRARDMLNFNCEDTKNQLEKHINPRKKIRGGPLFLGTPPVYNCGKNSIGEYFIHKKREAA